MKKEERKEKKEKSNIVLLCSLLIAICSLVSACFDVGSTQDAAGNGYGSIRIDIEEAEAAPQEARTVFPSFTFDKYVYTFTKDGTSKVETPASGGVFTLEVGTYTVKVEAFVTESGTDKLSASGTSASFTVNTGANSPVSVGLSAASGTGTFSYTINYPSGATIKTVSLLKWSDQSTISLSNSNISNGITGTKSLDSGSYFFTVLVEKGGLNAGINEAISIYPAKTTSYTKVFAEGDLLLGPKSITGFTFSGLGTGTINENAKTISVTVPIGTTVTGLTPTVTHTGTSYSPTGAQNFTSPVTYTVTAPDGSTQNYTVTVTVAAADTWDYYFWMPGKSSESNNYRISITDLKNKGFSENSAYPYNIIPWVPLDKELTEEMFWPAEDGGTAVMQIYVPSYDPDYTSYYPFNSPPLAHPTSWGDYLWQDRTKPGFRVPNEYYGESHEPGLGMNSYKVGEWDKGVISFRPSNLLASGIVIKLSKTAESYVPSVYKRLFTNVFANGSQTADTSKITLVFDMDIEGLSAADIVITANGTGATKNGTLIREGKGRYELGLTGITKSGNISVALNKSGHEPRPAYRNVYVWKSGDPADTGTWDYYFWAATNTMDITISDLRDKGWSEYGGVNSYTSFPNLLPWIPFDKGITDEMFWKEADGGSECMQIYMSKPEAVLQDQWDSYPYWVRVPNENYYEAASTVHEASNMRYNGVDEGIIKSILLTAYSRMIKISKVK